LGNIRIYLKYCLDVSVVNWVFSAGVSTVLRLVFGI